MGLDTVPSSKYFRKGGYPCLSCSYGDNKTCSMCLFAKWNVEGIIGGFAPGEAHRRAHKDAITNSPLMMRAEKKTLPIEGGIPHNQALPKVKLPFFPVTTYNGIAESLRKIARIRRTIG